MPTALEVLKRAAASPLFLIAAIAFSLQILLALVSSVTSVYAVSDVIGSFANFAYAVDLPELGEMYEMYEDVFWAMGDSLAVISFVLAFISSIPSIIAAIGAWMIFGTGASKNKPTFGTAGLTMIKVINLIALVFACIGYGLFVIIFLIALFAGIAVGEGAVIAVALIMLLIFGGIATLQILYFAKINSSINTVKNIAITGQPDNRISVYVAVWLFIGAFFNLFSFTLGGLCAATASALFGAAMLVLRSNMNKLINPPTVYAPTYAPDYAQTATIPAYNPAPQPVQTYAPAPAPVYTAPADPPAQTYTPASEPAPEYTAPAAPVEQTTVPEFTTAQQEAAEPDEAPATELLAEEEPATELLTNDEDTTIL